MNKVLIVDDIEENLQVVGTILTKYEISVLIARNGEQAVKVATKKLPDLILMDINMPVMNGYEACAVLKKDETTRDIPIIFLSALSENEDIIRGFEYGGVDYVSKPFNEQELVSRVKTHLQLKHSADIIKNQNNELDRFNTQLEKLVEKKTQNLIKSERKFRNIFDTSNDSIYITDLNGVYLEVNQIKLLNAACKYEELIGANIKDDYSGDQLYLIENYLKEAVKTGTAYFTGDYVNKKGVLLSVEKIGKIISHENQDAILHISRNITDRKLFERRMLMTTIETENRERKRFAKDIHDGLGVLLSSAKMYLNLLAKDNSDTAKRNQLVADAAKMLESAIQASKEISVNIRPKDLSKIGLKQSIEDFLERVNKIGSVKMHFNTENFDTLINPDIEVVFFRIISELINNSLKYAESENINIELKNNNEYLILSYKDDGKGFDFDKIMNSNKPGIGLNNIISRTKLIGGTPLIQSKPGDGISVHLTFPVSIISKSDSDINSQETEEI